MARVITDNGHYAAIADAIRVKLHSQDLYRPAEMAPAILSIEGGIRCPRGRAVGALDLVRMPEPLSWDNHAVGSLLPDDPSGE